MVKTRSQTEITDLETTLESHLRTANQSLALATVYVKSLREMEPDSNSRISLENLLNDVCNLVSAGQTLVRSRRQRGVDT